MPDRKYVLGLFRDENRAVSAVKALVRSPWELDRVYSPFPEHKIFDALKLKKSRVGYFTLGGGILGFFAGYGLSIYTAGQWNLIVSGKPIMALIPFFIVGFEFTILFAVIGNILGFLLQSRLPEFKSLEHYDPACSRDSFGLLASCAEGELQRLRDFFEEKGGEARIF